ncbi:hypothetical protein [Pelagicoccus albus]|uniref:Uncharacterized protein n=1 Tax=Pelagicoccus albus TaxID=415222 RepID=A0A7X1E884_9BACT|nr:hypothetical protein [Pelagicoccus albus]MBC2604507.1 hypothetical protein [Pelagicoccus albus]
MYDNTQLDIQQSDGTLQLRYPLEDWIEQLLAKYPEELASIRPNASSLKSDRLYQLQSSLKGTAESRQAAG